MKIKFDTNTKNSDKASEAWNAIAADCDPTELSLNLNTWNDLHYNLCGQVDSKYAAQLEIIFDANYFNEDTDKL